jgi:hypothetical protein
MSSAKDAIAKNIAVSVNVIFFLSLNLNFLLVRFFRILPVY